MINQVKVLEQEEGEEGKVDRWQEKKNKDK